MSPECESHFSAVETPCNVFKYNNNISYSQKFLSHYHIKLTTAFKKIVVIFLNVDSCESVEV
ncbi:27872_t:CDS:1, partial [Gigaspora margarita]